MKKIYDYICSKIVFMSEHLKQLFEFATSQGYKSNVLKPIIVGIIISIIGAVAGAYYKSQIITIGCLILAFIFVISFLIAYFFCLCKNPNLLRSERYNLEKTAIEKATYKGDSAVVGHINIPQKDYVLIEGNNGNNQQKEV